MDIKIEKSNSRHRLKLLAGMVLTATTIGLYQVQASTFSSSTMTIPANSVVINTVSEGNFSQTLSVRGQVEPRRTIYLDIKSGGVVEALFVEPGTYLEQGTPIAQLSNSDLQLQVISREAEVTEQLNFLRNTEMEMATNRLNIQRDIIELEHQVKQLQRKLKNTSHLAKQGLASEEELVAVQDQLDYNQKLLALSIERQEAEAEIRSVQRAQLESSKHMLAENLKFARKNLDNLILKSPASGYLSQLDAEIGESKAAGARLGQLDLPNDNILSVRVDEYYLSTIKPGMEAQIDYAGRKYSSTVSKIDSRVINSNFFIELTIPKEIGDLKRGQTLDVDIKLSNEFNTATILKRGAFFSDTGGNWVYVVKENVAEKRNIKIAAKNNDYYQIEKGLAFGEQVITSSYSSFNNTDRIILK